MALVVPQALVQTVRERLEAQDKLDRISKFQPQRANPKTDRSCRYLVTTTEVLEGDANGLASEECKLHLLTELDLQHLMFEISYTTNVISRPKIVKKAPYHSNKLARTVYEWLLSLPPTPSPFSTDHLISLCRWSYHIYPPIFLLPASTFSAEPWSDLLSVLPKELTDTLYASICKAFNTTHIALDGPIPWHSDDGPNVLRSPSNLALLYGDFGPSLAAPPEHNPSRSDFESAFWCLTSQNAIVQTWAPRYTMFSRGNLSEKKRILELGTLKQDGLEGQHPAHISAVDLYAGIGYFTFSYMKAGIGKVLCWELNPWSVEGMRRGAEENGWSFRDTSDDKDVADAEKLDNVVDGNSRKQEILVFQENNESAGERIKKLRDCIPPVRHVNCGLLPTSSGSWGTAVQVLDPGQGGWIHAHENVRTNDTEQRKDGVVETFEELARKHHQSHRLDISCSHIEIVKSYGPGINHMVFDIAILPSSVR